MIKSPSLPLRRGLSFITRSLGGSEASAPAANVSIIRFTQSIWVIVSGDSVPNREPNKTNRQAVTLIVNWNNRNFWMFRYRERPHITARVMLLNELSMIVMSLASFATEVPSPIDSPTCAAFRAGASLVPSPVTATTAPFCCNNCTRRCLSVGRARHMIFKSSTRSSASSSVKASKPGPVMMLRSVSPVFQVPICRPISLAVPGVSPVTILMSMPASRQLWTAAGTSARTGSEIATIPK